MPGEALAPHETVLAWFVVQERAWPQAAPEQRVPQASVEAPRESEAPHEVGVLRGLERACSEAEAQVVTLLVEPVYFEAAPEQREPGPVDWERELSDEQVFPADSADLGSAESGLAPPDLGWPAWVQLHLA